MKPFFISNRTLGHQIMFTPSFLVIYNQCLVLERCKIFEYISMSEGIQKSMSYLVF